MERRRIRIDAEEAPPERKKVPVQQPEILPATYARPSRKQDREILNELRFGDYDEMPHEFLLRIARGYPIFTRNKDGSVNEEHPSLEQRIRCANMAAPFFAPKLSAVEFTRGMSDELLNKLLEEYAAQAGVTITVDGESTAAEVSHALLGGPPS